MKIEHLYEFKVLAETGNFQVAADKLFLSQSALSKHIMMMEDELGFTLMEHKKNKFTLTPQGENFLPYATNMCDMWNDYSKSFMSHSQAKLLDIGVCHLSNIENDLFSDAVSLFKETYPNSMIRTSFISAGDNIENLLLKDDSNSPYCCLISKRLSSDANKFSSNISSQTLYTTPISIMTRADHPLAGKEFNLDELGRYSLISHSFYTTANALTRRVFRDSKVRAFFVHTFTSMRSIYEFIDKHNCIYMLTEPLETEDMPDNFVLTPVLSDVRVETFVAYTQDFEQQYEKIFLDCLLKKFHQE